MTLMIYMLVAGLVSVIVQGCFIWTKMWQPVDVTKKSPFPKYVALSFSGLGWPVLFPLLVFPTTRRKVWNKLME